MSSTTTTHRPSVTSIGPVEVSVTQWGEGRPFVLLHGGAGPQSLQGFAELLADAGQSRVIVPTHPGFGGTSRPEALSTVRELAVLYVALLDDLGLTDVTVVGNSIGGWIAAEMALTGSARIARVVVVNGTGIDVPGHPVADISSLTLGEVMQLSYHAPDAFRIDLSTLPAAAKQIAASNRATLAVYSGSTSTDPTLFARLAKVDLATLVVWGDSDQIVDVEYGRTYAAAIPEAQFEVLTETGHLPQIESPQKLIAVLDRFVAETAAWSHSYTAETSVAPPAIWATFRDLYTGTKLTERGDTIEIHGRFAAGTRMTAVPFESDIVIECVFIEVVEDTSLVFRSEFNGLMITSHFTLVLLPDGGTRITHVSTIEGPRAEKLGPVIGPRITEDHPDAMNDVIVAATARQAIR